MIQSSTLGIRLVSLLLAQALVAASIQGQATPDSEQVAAPQEAWSPDARNYSFGYWMNGFRKNTDDRSPDILAFETGHYGLNLNLNDLIHAQFGRLNNTNYAASLAAGAEPNKQLLPAELLIQVGNNDRVFTARRSVLGPKEDAKRLQDNRLWESGRYLQNFDIQHLIFEDPEGNQLDCEARLQVVGWPDSLTLTAEITPSLPFVDGPSFGVAGNGYIVADKPISLDTPEKAEKETFTLECWTHLPRNPAKTNDGWLLSKNGGPNDDGHIGFYHRNKRIEAWMNTGGGHRNRHMLLESSHKLFSFDNWYHLALTYDGKTMRFYINGRMVNSKDISGQRAPGAGALMLGGKADRDDNIGYGNFDQIRLWNRALTEDVIEAHTAKPQTASSQTGLIYEKTFDVPNDPHPKQYLWNNITTRIQLSTAEDNWEIRSPTFESWEIGKTRSLTLNCDLTPKKTAESEVAITVKTADQQTIQSSFNEALNCQVAEVKKLNRKWKTGYTDIRDYDEFTIEIENPNESTQEVPFMLYLRDEGNITGLAPILCLEDGTPTGIPVQLSKNWHYAKLGSYLRAYAMLPSQPGKQTYKLRIAYGFYGTLPSASHAQLSLVGYGGNGRWDQLAIGCWGETICFDVDRSCVDVAVTDVRMLMARIGANGKKWNWTNAGWGGDWLKIENGNGDRHHPSELKTAYFAHGPCLTDVRYDGQYGSQREVAFNAKVQTLRTDDFARTFQKFRYTFNKEVATKDAWLFKMGRTSHYATPRFAYGNADGLIQEIEAPDTLKRGDRLIDQVEITGSAPWWVSFPGAGQTRVDDKGNGYRALVIRGYKATLGGKVYTQPNMTVPTHQINRDGSKNLDFLLTAPKGIESFKPGDSIEMDLEWITLHREADDYYGPNEPYRQHITDNPSSWKTTYREAIGNDLKVDVKGGELLNNYPIQIQAQADEVTVQIKGGVGYVPIRFAGLPSANGHTLYQVIDGNAKPLDQSVHGNDFWQTDYDTATGTYSRVYNLPLDGLENSKWILRTNR